MKIKTTKQKDFNFEESSKNLWAHKSKLIITSSIIVFVFSVSFFFFYGMLTRYKYSKLLDKWLWDKGQYSQIKEKGIASELKKTFKIIRKNPKVIFGSLQSNNLEEVELSLKFKELFKLYNKRQEALAKGALVSEGDDYVSAKLVFEGKSASAKIRLKGDMVDHLSGRKWSYRVKLKSKDHFKGMRVFSIQHPKTRGYQWEPLFYEHLKREGILAPRYFFINTTLNGESIGIMAIEEHFSKEILESQQRREAPIIKIDESQSRKGALEYVTHLYNGKSQQIDVFRSSKTLSDPKLLGYYKRAVGLLQGFRDGSLSVDQVFDSKLMARFMAICEVWDAQHGLWWTNMRFYYNPIKDKLEPIGFDNNSYHFLTSQTLINSVHGIYPVSEFLKDNEFRDLFVTELKRVAKDIVESEFLAKLKSKEEKIINELKSEFYLISSIDWESLLSRSKKLQIINSDNIYYLRRDFYLANNKNFSTKKVGAYQIHLNDKTKIRIENFTNLPIFIKKIGKLSNGIEKEIKIVDKAIPPSDYYSKSSQISIDLEKQEEKSELFVIYDFNGVEKRENILVYNDGFQSNKLAPINKNIEQVPSFFKKEGNSYRVKKGTYQVRKPIIGKQNFSLNVDPGVRIKFCRDCYVIIKGSVNFDGNSNQRIFFEPLNDSWKGMLVYKANSQSKVSFSDFNKTTFFKPYDEWGLTGAINFYQSEVLIENSNFNSTQAEDALNIIRSNFKIVDSNFFNTRSDAFDCDFCVGSFYGGKFVGVGGDGIDVSGAKINVENTKFEDINDKAVSVGEGSDLTAKFINVYNSGTAFAAKDRSFGSVSNSVFKNINHIPIMAYIKKPEYGPAKLVAENIIFDDGITRKGLSQTGSSLKIDGKLIESEDIDIKKLYKSGYMKK